MIKRIVKQISDSSLDLTRLLVLGQVLTSSILHTNDIAYIISVMTMYVNHSRTITFLPIHAYAKHLYFKHIILIYLHQRKYIT